MDPDELDRRSDPFRLPVNAKVMQPEKPPQEYAGLFVPGHDDGTRRGRYDAAHGPQTRIDPVVTIRMVSTNYFVLFLGRARGALAPE
jgi:hypothetical protein